MHCFSSQSPLRLNDSSDKWRKVYCVEKVSKTRILMSKHILPGLQKRGFMIRAAKHHLKILFSTLAASFKLLLQNTCEHVFFKSLLDKWWRRQRAIRVQEWLTSLSSLIFSLRLNRPGEGYVLWGTNVPSRPLSLPTDLLRKVCSRSHINIFTSE